MKVLMLKAVGAVLIVQERREFKSQGIKFKVRIAKRVCGLFGFHSTKLRDPS